MLHKPISMHETHPITTIDPSEYNNNTNDNNNHLGVAGPFTLSFHKLQPSHTITNMAAIRRPLLGVSYVVIKFRVSMVPTMVSLS